LALVTGGGVVVTEVMVVVVCFSRVTKAMVAGGGVVVSEVMAVVVWFSRATTAMVAGVGGVGRGMVSVGGGCDNIGCVASETREVAAMAVPAVVLGMLPSLPVGIKCDGFMHTPCNARSDCLC
jgi:ABC-type hemin transport system substrate-binding protein